MCSLLLLIYLTAHKLIAHYTRTQLQHRSMHIGVKPPANHNLYHHHLHTPLYGSPPPWPHTYARWSFHNYLTTILPIPHASDSAYLTIECATSNAHKQKYTHTIKFSKCSFSESLFRLLLLSGLIDRTQTSLYLVVHALPCSSVTV